MPQSSFNIPVTSSIKEFLTHLRSHQRTILSARYGDGKSYFLNALQKDDDALADFTFLTIYPINYQVEENKDIFELVKRDILLQMIMKGMISSDYKISDSVAISFFLQNNMPEVADSLVPFIGSIFNQLDYRLVMAGSCFQLFRELKSKVDQFKEQCSDQETIKTFLKKVEENKASIHFDAITQIISDNIDNWQKTTNKRVVLIFEDMDRIDPAHLFRILNVLSAHMDYGYSYGLEVDESLVGNKFGVDNIVVVLDYDNLCSIFHHFYGKETNFKGYIDKFATAGPFRYSFMEKRNQFVIEEIARLTDLPVGLVAKILPGTHLENIEMRRIVNSFEALDSQITIGSVLNNQREEVIPSHKMLKMYVLMRRLGISDDDIVQSVSECLNEDFTLLCYFVAYVYSFTHPSFPADVDTNDKKSNGGTSYISTIFNGVMADGDADIKHLRYAKMQGIRLKPYSEIARSLLQFIAH